VYKYNTKLQLQINAIQYQNHKIKTKSKPTDNELKSTEWGGFCKLEVLDIKDSMFYGWWKHATEKNSISWKRISTSIAMLTGQFRRQLKTFLFRQAHREESRYGDCLGGTISSSSSSSRVPCNEWRRRPWISITAANFRWQQNPRKLAYTSHDLTVMKIRTDHSRPLCDIDSEASLHFFVGKSLLLHPLLDKCCPDTSNAAVHALLFPPSS